MENLNIPQHVAIILDGNGRWAKKRHLPRNMGHRQGSKVVEQIIEDAHDLGIKYLTVYAFSTENWKRAEEEVKSLMLILQNYLEHYAKVADSENIKIQFLGDTTALNEKMQERIKECIERTKDNTGVHFNIALNYGGRAEIVRAAKEIAKEVENKTISLEDINEDLLESKLYTAGQPDPDLVIRTSGEMRTSNFLPWQLVYLSLIHI